jgi:hypothetical protein
MRIRSFSVGLFVPALVVRALVLPALAVPALVVPALAVLALVSLPQSLQAQFQQPTGDELKLAAEPKAPGAEAIYLFREEPVDDTLHYHSFYARIKVLSEKGKELATVEVPYLKGQNQITDVKGRTIHADGTVVPLNVKPSDLVDVKSGGVQVNRVVFTLPSAEVGSILEYRWSLRYPDEWLSSPYWDIQQPYFVRKAHYSFIPTKNLGGVTSADGKKVESSLLYTTMLPANAQVVKEASGRYTLDVTDVPASPREDFMPPIDALLERVVFYYSAYLSKDDFWKHEGGDWSKEMDRFAGETRTLKDAVAKIVGPSDTEEQKARKIYDAVMTLENTDYTREKSRAERRAQHVKQVNGAEGVWTAKSGSSDEIALTYLAMVRSAGLKAYAISLSNRDSEVFNPYYLSMNQVHDVLVGVMLNGKEVPVDPGKLYAPFGSLAWKHIQSSGLQQSDHGTSFVSMPVNSYKDASVRRIADVLVSKDGSVSGTVRVSMVGPEATRWREAAVENDEDEVKKRFVEQMQGEVPAGVTVEFDHFLGLQDYRALLMAVFKISGSMGTMTGKRIFLPGAFFESRAKYAFAEEAHRQTPVNMEFAEASRDDVNYHLAEGFTVESAPAPSTTPWPGYGAFELASSVDKGQVTVTRSFVRAFAVLEAKQYPALRDFYQKVASADQQQLVLTVGPAASGSE